MARRGRPNKARRVTPDGMHYCPYKDHFVPEGDFYRNPTTGTFDAYCRKCKHEWRMKEGRIRLRVLAQYGSKCAACGEDDIVVLELDHIDPALGKEQRKAGWSNNKWYHHIVEHPELYQCLCRNCNWRKKRTGSEFKKPIETVLP